MNMDHNTIRNVHHIQQLNQNCIALDRNIQFLEQRLEKNSSTFTSLITEMARDASAFQRAIIDFLKEKDIICGEEDMKHLQRLHLRHVARIDQEIAKKKDELKERDLDEPNLL